MFSTFSRFISENPGKVFRVNIVTVRLTKTGRLSDTLVNTNTRSDWKN